MEEDGLAPRPEGIRRPDSCWAGWDMISEVFSQRRKGLKCARVGTRNVGFPSGGGADFSLSLFLIPSVLSFVGVGSVAGVVGSISAGLYLRPPRWIHRQAARKRSPHKV